MKFQPKPPQWGKCQPTPQGDLSRTQKDARRHYEQSKAPEWHLQTTFASANVHAPQDGTHDHLEK